MVAIKLFKHYLFFIHDKEVKNMAVIYVALIIKGKRTYSQLPEVIKPQVREILVDLELEALIDE